FQFDPVGKEKFESTGCDIARSALAKAGVSYTSVTRARRSGEAADVWIGNRVLVAPEPWRLAEEDRAAAAEAFRKELAAATAAAGYPEKADLAAMNKPLVVAILFYLVLLVTMVYGPIAALLVELFPSRIRYTAMSLPYHIGNGWFGGFLPTTAFAMVAATGNIYYGLWYPVIVAVITLVIGLLFLPETFRRSLHTQA
ncbi:MAG: MFS transporter, partial [Sphingopyxis sp.]|uniref:MFS transporter n=1 Tax=Sphingopyxis sp. TaxID=1908224 RepID=UPI001A2F72D0